MLAMERRFFYGRKQVTARRPGRRGQRHPHRAPGRRRPHPLAPGRCPLSGRDAPQGRPGETGKPHQSPGRPGHRQPPPAPGRAHRLEGRGTTPGPAGQYAADSASSSSAGPRAAARRRLSMRPSTRSRTTRSALRPWKTRWKSSWRAFPRARSRPKGA